MTRSTSLAIRLHSEPAVAGQFCTRPTIVNRLDPFLPRCPITSRYNVIPAGYNGRLHAFDTGFTSIQTLFTGTIAKVASLVAIVIGGYGFAHGEPGAKKALAGVAAGTGIAVLAVNVLTWLWGV
jgi:type IV secretory pathway VirB2 component (pilin)